MGDAAPKRWDLMIMEKKETIESKRATKTDYDDDNDNNHYGENDD